MISKERLAELFTWSGLFLLILLTFEVLSWESFRIGGNVIVDSTFIVALIDIAIVGFGLAIYSRKIARDMDQSEDMNEVPFSELGGIMATFLLSTLVLLLAFRAIPWDTVEWFDPPLNFQLIRAYFKSNLFISLLLILALTIILAHNGVESKHKSDEKNRIKKTTEANNTLSKKH